MKTPIKNVLLRTVALVSLLSFAVTGVSCMTTYDAYGRPVQSVDPGAAVAGVAAAGVLGYALGRDRDNYNNHRHHGYYGRPYRGYYDRPHRGYY